MNQINDLQIEVGSLKEENRTLQMKLMNLSSTEQAKAKLNILEEEINDLNFEGKCIETVKMLSEILVSIII